MKYKKLDLTIREKIERLMDKEVFYNEDGCLEYLFSEENGFIIDSGLSAGSLDISIDFYTPETWEDEVSPDNPVLCWISDDNTEDRSSALHIIAVTESGYRYLCSSGHQWKYATPVQPKECYGYEG